jgi:hypothetical protein
MIGVIAGEGGPSNITNGRVRLFGSHLYIVWIREASVVRALITHVAVAASFSCPGQHFMTCSS